jgi:beta-phosphoglucomutase family hydrolase
MPDSGFNAVIFDLDGVITKTALVHSAAWTKMFNEFLADYGGKTGQSFREFSHTDDYLPYVDGKPRYKGVESFLLSRGIGLPWGDPSDTEDMQTIYGLGNRKNRAFNEVLARDGVQVYPSTIELIRRLKEEHIHVGVASSSKNCKAVLESAGILDLFETRVDGVVSAELGLLGKPEPDIFTTACDNLGVTYDRAVVVEDAVSGVQAGAKGNFGFVLGIAREENETELKVNGADIVVKDISEIGFEGIVNWFRDGLVKDSWSVSYNDYHQGKEKTREALLAVGNGYFGTRGSMEEQTANGINYPGTYMAGIYNRLVSKVADRDVENEDFVNGINWLGIRFRIGNEDWIDLNQIRIISISRTLYLFQGVLEREMTLADSQGRLTQVTSKRMASMANPHVAALEYTITPVNYSGMIFVRSTLSGDHINDGVDRYRQLNQKHIKGIESGGEDDLHYLGVMTTQSGIRIFNAATYTIYKDGKFIHPDFNYDHSGERSTISFGEPVGIGQSLSVHKMVAMFTSQDKAITDIKEAAIDTVMLYSTFDEVAKESAGTWEEMWAKMDIRIEGDRLAQKLLRLHLYHLMVSVSPNNAWIDAGYPARGLHGEAYRGHIFWDELYILPLYNIHFPDVSRSLLMYRYRRLEEARKYARENGYNGAMFPWQSGSDGREETQTLHLNPVSGEWGADHSSLQRHVSLAIAYNVWQYFWITGDAEFMKDNGAEMFFEICRFWAGKCEPDPKTGRYSIGKVMGPDEFHEKYPGTNEGGLRDNTYTNLMVVWMLERANDLLTGNDRLDLSQVIHRIHLTEDEISKWKEITGKLKLVVSTDGILAQYDGYFDLKELDWDYFKKKYGNIYRMDRLLKAEGKSPDEYKVAKQADTLMTFYNLDKQEVDRILEDLDYSIPTGYLPQNLRYYLARTSHGSTLSRVVHAQLANMIGDKELSWTLYHDALTSDYQDIQGGTTAEGIHAGVMAGTVWIATSAYAGLNLRSGHVTFQPALPDHWRSIAFAFTFRGTDYQCVVTRSSVRIRANLTLGEPIAVVIAGFTYTMSDSEWLEYTY